MNTEGDLKPIPKDPAASTEHLTPGGKRRHRRVTNEEREDQIRRYESAVEARSSEIIPRGLPTPGDNLKVRIKKILGMNTD